MSSNKHFLWPKIKINILNFFGTCNQKKLELFFQKMFPSGHPVLCSSGRVALYISVNESKLRREDKLKLFPYASHCVINTVSRLTTPVTHDYKTPNIINYHQWGIKFSNSDNTLIEDSVDSLYKKNTPLFNLGANYEIWSLPKILGTSSGGILWCKNESDAIRIRNQIRGGKKIFFNWILRLLSLISKTFYDFWEGTEYGYKGLSLPQRNEIFKKAKMWEKLVADREEKTQLFINKSILNDQDINGRYPSCIPILTNRNEDEIEKMGLSVGLRHFYDGENLVKVLPLPIHQDVSIKFLRNILEKI